MSTPFQSCLTNVFTHAQKGKENYTSWKVKDRFDRMQTVFVNKNRSLLSSFFLKYQPEESLMRDKLLFFFHKEAYV